MPKSMHGKVQSYFMPLEEFYQKYGFYPPKHPDLIKRMGGEVQEAEGKQKRKNWRWAKITLQQYLDLKDQGKLDSEIIKEHPWLTYEKLHHLKKKWGLIKHVYVKEIVKDNDKQYIQETFSTYILGFCVRSTMKKRKPSLKDAFVNVLG